MKRMQPHLNVNNKSALVIIFKMKETLCIGFVLALYWLIPCLNAVFTIKPHFSRILYFALGVLLRSVIQGNG